MENQPSNGTRPTRVRTPRAHGGQRPDRRPQPAEDREPGTVKISATPWAEVTVLGRPDGCAETPCVLRLSPGRHTLRLRNPVARLTKDIRVTVESGKTVVINTSLTP